MNTNLAAVAGSPALLARTIFGKPDITMACNGMLAGSGDHCACAS